MSIKSNIDMTLSEMALMRPDGARVLELIFIKQVLSEKLESYERLNAVADLRDYQWAHRSEELLEVQRMIEARINKLTKMIMAD